MSSSVKCRYSMVGKSLNGDHKIRSTGKLSFDLFRNVANRDQMDVKKLAGLQIRTSDTVHSSAVGLTRFHASWSF